MEHLCGDMIVVRYADDTVVGFLSEHDARHGRPRNRTVNFFSPHVAGCRGEEAKRGC